MEYCLKDTKCPICNGKIIVIPYKESNTTVVSHGTCVECLKDMILPSEPFDLFVREYCEKYKFYEHKKVLECSSAGDSRFSALYAKVKVNGITDTIENHYQKSKVFLENNKFIQYDDFKKAKGKKPIAFNIGGFILPLRFGAMFYHMLWYKYLKVNKNLQDVLSNYDDYSDKFKGKSFVCQATSIRLFMNDINGNKLAEKDRGNYLYSVCKELNDFLLGKNRVIIEEGDIFEGIAEIIGHQVNCQNVMGSGIALQVRRKYTKAYDEYMKFSVSRSENLLGNCQIVDCGDKIIANLFGQFNYGTDKNIVYTKSEALKKALITLKNYAKDNKKIVALPYNIGCDRGNGDWSEILKIIEDIFKDYYVILYKYKK